MESNEFKENELVKKIFTKLKRKLVARGFKVEDEDVYDEIETAIETVNSRRRFVPTSNILVEEKYSNLVSRLCIASISKWGAEGETSHSENGINRRYEKGSEYPESMLSEIIPLGRAKK